MSAEAKAAPTTVPPADFAKKSFDYLIIGGGTAGLTLASRLAENPAVQVGIIEAGNFILDDPIIDQPAYVGVAPNNPKYDWGFKTVPQAGLNGVQVPAARGKMVGGTSGINYLGWNRASKAEYDTFNAFAPDSSWTWDGLLPYFERASSTTGTTEAASAPITSMFPTFSTEPVPTFVETLKNIGIPSISDQNAGVTSGVYNTRITVAGGKRSYATEYYYRSAKQDNFHLVADALAEKILFAKEADSLKATGVQFSVNSEVFSAIATKEVILSAGTFQTPQLLELSGIGNKQLLDKFGIQTLVDLPQVGENLQEHLFSAASFEVKPGFKTYDELRNNEAFAAEQAHEYKTNGTGALASMDTTISFLQPSYYLSESQVAENLVRFDESVKAGAAKSPLQELALSIQRKWLVAGNVPEAEIILFTKGLFGMEPGKSYVTLLTGSMHPVARGSVHISSTSPADPPSIDPNYLSNDYDLHTILGALKLALKLEKLAPFSELIQTRLFPPPGDLADADLIGFIKMIAQPGGHPLGTAALGPKELGGVVDANLKVYGTQNLRVVDASVIPIHIGAHIQQTVYAIAEKIAEVIKRES